MIVLAKHLDTGSKEERDSRRVIKAVFEDYARD